MRWADQEAPDTSLLAFHQAPEVTWVVIRPVREVGVAFYLARPDEVVLLFDVELAAIANQHSLDVFTAVVECVGLTTGREVLLSGEGDPGLVLGWYDPEFDTAVIGASAGAGG
jgi:hypothetical protein